MKNEKLNIAKANKFSILVDKLPQLTQLTRSIAWPDIESQALDLPYGGMTARASGSALTFGTLAITFQMDEYHTTYRDIINWMTSGSGHQVPGPPTTNKLEAVKSDILIDIHTNSSNEATSYTFVGCVPTGISMNELSRGSADDLGATVQFEFDYLKDEE